MFPLWISDLCLMLLTKHRRPLSDAVIPTDKISPAASVLPVPLIYTNRPPWSSSPWKFWSQQDCNSLLLNWARKNVTNNLLGKMKWGGQPASTRYVTFLHLKFPLFSLTGWWWWAWNGDKEPVQRWGYEACLKHNGWSAKNIQWWWSRDEKMTIVEV